MRRGIAWICDLYYDFVLEPYGPSVTIFIYARAANSFIDYKPNIEAVYQKKQTTIKQFKYEQLRTSPVKLFEVVFLLLSYQGLGVL